MSKSKGTLIAFSGMIGAGKSYTMGQIINFLQDSAKRTVVERKYPRLCEYASSQNIITFFEEVDFDKITEYYDSMKAKGQNKCFGIQVEFLIQKLRTLKKRREFKGLMLDDRSWEENMIFATLQHDLGLIDDMDFNIISNFFKAYSRFMPTPDYYVFFDAGGVDRLQSNIKRRGSAPISQEYLENLNVRYKAWAESKKKKKKIIVIDNSKDIDMKKVMGVLESLLEKDVEESS